MKKVLITLIVFISLSIGCTTMLGYPPLRETVEIELDDFENNITVLGISSRLPYDKGQDNPYTFMMIRSFVDKENHDQIIHQVYAHYHYNFDWRFYNAAFFEGGELAEFLEINRDVDCSQYGCSYYEDFAITVTDDFLRSNTNGFKVKVVSKSGHDLIITVSGLQVSEQLNAIDAL